MDYLLLALLIVLIIILIIRNTNERYDNKISCKKWEGEIVNYPWNICKDCGYPRDCHGPYKGESWRHIFRERFY